MNAREGFCRIGLLLGTIGAIVGIAGTWLVYEDLAYRHNENVQFQTKAGEYWRVLTKLRYLHEGDNANTWDAAEARYLREKELVAGSGISSVDKNGTHINSITLKGGTYLTDRPISPLDCLWPLTLPFIGFLVPWGAIKIIFWVISGFTHKTSAAV